MDNELVKLFYIIGLVLIFLVVIYLTISYSKFPPKIIETLSNKDYLILMGDSIFKNDVYVNEGNSVGENLQSVHGNVIVLAEDNAIIDDIEKQTSLIPNNAKKQNTKIVVSVGGNDLLNKYNFNDVNNLSHVDTIFNQYTSSINNLKNKFDCEIILCNIYYPRSESVVRYYDIIDLWNSKIKNYAKVNNLKVIKLDENVDKEEYFTNEIEPSGKGSKIISDVILNSNL